MVARNPKALPYLREGLTTQVVRDYFAHLLEKDSVVERYVLESFSPADVRGSGFHRYELPGINALNFVITKALGGGGVSSLRCDPQVL